MQYKRSFNHDYRSRCMYLITQRIAPTEEPLVRLEEIGSWLYNGSNNNRMPFHKLSSDRITISYKGLIVNMRISQAG